VQQPDARPPEDDGIDADGAEQGKRFAGAAQQHLVAVPGSAVNPLQPTEPWVFDPCGRKRAIEQRQQVVGDSVELLDIDRASEASPGIGRL
jgi:hypothetical protein